MGAYSHVRLDIYLYILEACVYTHGRPFFLHGAYFVSSYLLLLKIVFESFRQFSPLNLSFYPMHFSVLSLQALMPVFTVLLSRCLLGERQTTKVGGAFYWSLVDFRSFFVLLLILLSFFFFGGGGVLVRSTWEAKAPYHDDNDLRYELFVLGLFIRKHKMLTCGYPGALFILFVGSTWVEFFFFNVLQFAEKMFSFLKFIFGSLPCCPQCWSLLNTVSSRLEEAQWPIGCGVGLRIKRSSVRIRPWPLRWVLGQGSLLPLSQGEAFTLASISYLAILVKYILARKNNIK